MRGGVDLGGRSPRQPPVDNLLEVTLEAGPQGSQLPLTGFEVNSQGFFVGKCYQSRTSAVIRLGAPPPRGGGGGKIINILLFVSQPPPVSK